MNTEKTHFRTIPEEEYQQLKALAELNKKAIYSVVDTELEGVRSDYNKSNRILRDSIRAIDDLADKFGDLLRELGDNGFVRTEQERAIRKMIRNIGMLTLK